MKTKFSKGKLGVSESVSYLNPFGNLSAGSTKWAKPNTLSPLFAKFSLIFSKSSLNYEVIYYSLPST